MKKPFLIFLILITLGWMVSLLPFITNGSGTYVANNFGENGSGYVGYHDSVEEQLYAELESDEVYNDSILYGFWFKPHEANAMNIFLHKNNTFEFRYYIVDENDSCINLFCKGTYTYDGRVVRLSSKEGYDIPFDGELYYDHNGTNGYLTDNNDSLYLIKGV